MKSVPFESAWSKLLHRETILPLLEQQGKSLLCIGSADSSLICFHFSVGLVGYQNIIQRCLMAHSKAISCIYVLFIIFTIFKCHMALKLYFLCHFSRGGTHFHFSSRLPEHHKKIFYSSHKIYCSYLRFSYKFHHLQFPNGTEKVFLCHVSSGKIGAIGLAEVKRVMFNSSFESYCSYLRSYQFFHSLSTI